jgi:serine/threonine protein phosphatase 1
VLDWLCDRQDQDGDRCITLRGNHDLMMLEARRSAADFEVWMSCNGDTTLASYGLPPVRASLDRVPVRHWRFLEQTRLYHEADRQFFVHGNVYPDLPLDEQPSYMLLWEKFYDPVPHASGKRMVCGHTSQKDGRIADLGHSTCIDTWACGDGWLTALDPDSDRYWKANQAGATQTGRLGGAYPLVTRRVRFFSRDATHPGRTIRGTGLGGEVSGGAGMRGTPAEGIRLPPTLSLRQSRPVGLTAKSIKNIHLNQT